MKGKIGTIIIILSFLVSLNPYWLIFGIPLFIIGVVILSFSTKDIIVKLIWIVAPLILWYPSVFLFFYLIGTIGTATAQKLDLIFTENFKGKAIVIPNMPCGESIEIVENREQLKIPENGILLYKGDLKSGYVNNRYFKVDKKGEKTELPFRANYMYFENSDKKPDEKVVGVWLRGIGKKYNPNHIGGINYEYREYIVSSKDSLEKQFDFKRLKKLEELTDSIVDKCKNGKYQN